MCYYLNVHFQGQRVNVAAGFMPTEICCCNYSSRGTTWKFLILSRANYGVRWSANFRHRAPIYDSERAKIQDTTPAFHAFRALFLEACEFVCIATSSDFYLFQFQRWLSLIQNITTLWSLDRCAHLLVHISCIFPKEGSGLNTAGIAMHLNSSRRWTSLNVCLRTRLHLSSKFRWDWLEETLEDMKLDYMCRISSRDYYSIFSWSERKEYVKLYLFILKC